MLICNRKLEPHRKNRNTPPKTTTKNKNKLQKMYR